MKNKKLPNAVVLGMTATGLSVARSLGRKKIKVYGIDISFWQPGMFSRYVTPKIAPDPIKKEQEFISYLKEFGKKLPYKAILFFANDECLSAVSRNREDLERYFVFNMPSKNTVENFLDKRRSCSIAQQNGIQCPATFVIEKTEELINIKDRINFPCALKPAISHLWRVSSFGKKKLIRVNSYYDLVTCFEEVRKIYPQIMIQEIIPGSDDQIYLFYAYFDAMGEPIAFSILRKLRQHPINFGIGSYNISEINEEIERIGLEFLKKIKYRGIVGLELKRDSASNKIKFLEMNMRFIMIGELAIASGVDLPYIMYKDLIGEKVENTRSFKGGIKLVNMELDLGSFWQYRKAKKLTFGQYINSFKNGKIRHTYFAIDDLIPFFYVCIRFIKVIVFILFRYIKKYTRKEAIINTFDSVLIHAGEVVKSVYGAMPVKVCYGKRFLREYEFLQGSQWWSRQELQNYQSERLQSLVKHVYENVPYYRELFNAHKLTPNDIKSADDLPKIPILTKEDVRKNFKMLIATNFKIKNLKLLHTSGTTGIPFHFYTDLKNEYLAGAPVQWRFFNWGGRRFHDVSASLDIWSLKPYLSGKRPLFQYNPVQRCLFLSMYNLSSENIKEYADVLQKYSPVFLKVYPSALEQLIRLLKVAGIKPNLNIKTIFTNAEILYPWQRTLFRDYFKCDVLEWYALQERTIAAAQCEEQDAYHISPEYGIFEFMNKQCLAKTNNPVFEIVGTGLSNFGMPLIRYKTNDIGFPINEKCKCGRGLPLMRLLGDRERNLYLNKYGTITPFTIINITAATENIKQYQFVQEEKGNLR